ncbi:RsmF rRNA methyltransferase first C-terminal domain-containing protein [Alkalicella caledoniensis]|uniref:RsmF rRNA methyltransferase first C-terminal domain-containing protein n=1 Tax=Alkalicella caledoniensis TaxID=2731377 RepID=A0A7G9W8T2_ALKCA|nr:RsmB/NOP family class I SAM-dependent RNA methyltransferase [Alkalicella caledoniensis]QNO15094.1 RsmF rRNA methyltransferase first C-terminal domain-containing protein [Alkalicella caledoniensis]
MNLPQPFIDKMKCLLGADYEKFVLSYNFPKYSGLRANGLKLTPEELTAMLPYLDDKIPWSSDGFYYNEETVRPAKSPLYYAGLYYIQEPSAMMPAELLDVKEGDRVLDLCAAPGGKSLQLAAKIGDSGLLVVNDISSNRAKVLLKNMERYGVRNLVVLNDSPEKIAAHFKGFFDKILVDAPCSGEGMFRKEPDMIKGWSEEEVLKYSSWQREILGHIPALLRPGGNVVYSTCTFSPEENEAQVRNLASENNQFKILKETRLWPHEVRGEGHFVSLLHNEQDTLDDIRDVKNTKSLINLPKESMEAVQAFTKDIWDDPNLDFLNSLMPSNGILLERSGHILWESNLLPNLKGLRVLRSGWLLGTIAKGRFKPSQAFSMGLSKDYVIKATQILNFDSSQSEDMDLAIRFLKGETIQKEDIKWAKGWHLISIDNFPLGWAKSAGLWLKNEYPPGWRWIDGD